MREAQVLQGAIDRVVRYRERILLVEPHDQIARPPANHTVDSRDRTLLYDPSEKGPVRIVALGRHARRRDIDETVRPLRVEPTHPVTMSVSQSRLCETHPARSNAQPFRGLAYPNWSNSSRFSALIARQTKSAMPTIISIRSAARAGTTPGSLAPRRMQVSLKS